MMYAQLTGSVNGSSSQQATPTPDAPICIVSDTYYRKSDNLFNKDDKPSSVVDYGSGAMVYISSTKLVGSQTETSDNVRTIKIPCSPNTSYAVTFVNAVSTKRIATTSVEPTADVGVSQYVQFTASSYTITTNGTANWLVIQLYIDSDYGAGRTWSTESATLMVVKGDTAQTYEPYNAYYPVEMRSVGSGSSEIADTYNGSVARNVAQYVCTGQENDWGMDFGTGMFHRSLIISSAEVPSVALGLSNHFAFNSVQSGMYSNLQDGQFALQINSSNLKLFCKNMSITSVADWETWLQSLYNAGTPVIIQYALKEPTTETVTLYKYTRGFRAVHQRLPDGYTELEYIQSSGSQYIDTGISPITEKTAVEMRGLINNGNSAFGGHGASSSSSYQFNVTSVTASSIPFRYGNIRTSITTTNNEFYSTVATIKFGNGEMYLDGELKQTLTVPSFTYTYTLKIFSRETGADIGRGIVEFVRVYEEDELIFNGVPCKRNSDSAIGMYDLVNNVFHTNAGTGTFTAGSEVSNILRFEAVQTIDNNTVKFRAVI